MIIDYSYIIASVYTFVNTFFKIFQKIFFDTETSGRDARPYYNVGNAFMRSETEWINPFPTI